MTFVGTLGRAEGAADAMVARALASLESARSIVHDAGCASVVPVSRRADVSCALASAVLDEVVTQLMDAVEAGRDVVRLVDGDVVILPSARTLDELAALTERGVEVELVASVPAFAAAAARAGTVFPEGSRLHVDGTLVQLGSTSATGPLAARVLPWPPRRGARSTKASVTSPSSGRDVVVEGALPIVPTEDAPLFGRSVLVTRAREQASGTARLLRARGALPIELPTIVLGPPDDPAALDAAARALSSYTHVLFTSANGVAALFDALDRVGLDARAFGASRVAAIGPGTARELRTRGVRPDLMPEEHRGEALAELILQTLRDPPGHDVSGARVLLARAAVARDVLPTMLTAAGVHVDVVHAYRTRHPDAEIVERLRASLGARQVDVAIFTASSTVTQLCDLIDDAPALLRDVTIASIGPITSDACRARGLHVDVEASPYTLDALVDALERFFRTRT